MREESEEPSVCITARIIGVGVGIGIEDLQTDSHPGVVGLNPSTHNYDRKAALESRLF